LKVLVFDIDGTLTQTTRVDSRIFNNAVQAVLPAADVESIEGFVEMTDTAILRKICSDLGETQYASVEARVLEQFMAGLSTAFSEEPSSFSAVPGAQQVFSAVRDAGWVPAMATGAWRPSAELKLKAAEIPTTGVPLSTSSEATRRLDIIQNAVRKATSDTEPDELVYVGDGIWDINACRELGIGFIGRAEGDEIESMMRRGARAVVPDFNDLGSFLHLLSQPHRLVLSAGQA
jgi:phosphoglycolate phosphatase-like HAD superfamily hydrolase